MVRVMVTSSSHDSRGSSRPATSADVAKRAGVSRATVSYILNGKRGVSFTAETRDAVLRAAKELAYQPNAAAKSLVSGSGPIVVVMSSLPQNETTAAVVLMLAGAFAARGHLATFFEVSDDLASTVDSIVAMRPRAALLVFPAAGELGTKLAEAGVSVTGIDRLPISFTVGETQVAYLVERGHSRIAFADVVGSEGFGVLPRRAEVIDACAKAGLGVPPSAEVSRDGIGASDVVAAWHRDGVTAVCAYNDEVALAVLHGIREAGLRCPEDLAVIGCDDIPAAAVAYPPLTTVAINVGHDLSWMVDAILHQLGLTAEAPAHPPTRLARVAARASA